MELLILSHMLSKPSYPGSPLSCFFLFSSLVYDVYLYMHNLPARVLDSVIANTRMRLRLPKG